MSRHREGADCVAIFSVTRIRRYGAAVRMVRKSEEGSS